MLHDTNVTALGVVVDIFKLYISKFGIAGMDVKAVMTATIARPFISRSSIQQTSFELALAIASLDEDRHVQNQLIENLQNKNFKIVEACLKVLELVLSRDVAKESEASLEDVCAKCRKLLHYPQPAIQVACIRVMKTFWNHDAQAVRHVLEPVEVLPASAKRLLNDAMPDLMMPILDEAEIQTEAPTQGFHQVSESDGDGSPPESSSLRCETPESPAEDAVEGLDVILKRKVGD